MTASCSRVKAAATTGDCQLLQHMLCVLQEDEQPEASTSDRTVITYQYRCAFTAGWRTQAARTLLWPLRSNPCGNEHLLPAAASLCAHRAHCAESLRVCRVGSSLRAVFGESATAEALYSPEQAREALHSYAARQGLQGSSPSTIVLDKLLVGPAAFQRAELWLRPSGLLNGIHKLQLPRFLPCKLP